MGGIKCPVCGSMDTECDVEEPDTLGSPIGEEEEIRNCSCNKCDSEWTLTTTTKLEIIERGEVKG